MEIPINRLKYTLHSPSAGDREVFPTGESQFKISFELHDQEGDPLYDYIIKFNGNLVFAGSDYEWIKAIEDDTSVRGEDLLIEIQDKSTLEILVDGTRIILNDGFFDLDNCTVEIPVTTPDVYEDFNAAKGDEINFFDLLVSGPFYDINTLDYIPKFETHYHEHNYPVGTNTFLIGAQHFEGYPNSKAQYPGYSVAGEKPDPQFPDASQTLFVHSDLVDLANDAVDAHVFLNTGTKPFHGLYGDADDAVADGWRLYAFRYDIFSNGSDIGYLGHYCWIREVKDVPTGTVMTAEWVAVSSGGGTDRFARPALLVPRTNINRTAFVTDAFPGEQQVRIMQTTYVVGLDIANIVAGSTFPPPGTAPADPIVDTLQDQEYKNFYSFEKLTNGKKLNDIIEFTIGKCDPTLVVVSDFFQINPLTISADNYVTGLPSFVDNIIMFQKSDVKRPFATNKATRGIYTADKLFMWLLEMFNVKYRIEGGYFILEHITSPQFVKPATLDLTVAPLNERLAGLRRYSYDQEKKLPAKETFAFMEMKPQGDTEPLNDLNGLPIIYYGSNVDRSEDSGVLAHLVDGVTTDVYYILIHSGGIGYLIDQNTKNPYPVQDAANDDTISDDGFVLVASKVVVTGMTSERYLFQEDPIIGANREMNNVLGWAFLHRDFFMTNRNTKKGELNGTPVTFTTTKYIKKSVELNFDVCNVSDFDPFELITSALGDGIVKTAEFSIFDSTMTVVLGYQE